MSLLRSIVLPLALASSTLLKATPPPPPTPCNTALWALDERIRSSLVQGSPGMLVEAAVRGEPFLVRPTGWANVEHRVQMRRESVFAIASVTKQFTAAAILALMEEGKLKLDDKLSLYVPELPQASRVTLYQLLVQTSGIPDYSEDPEGSRTKSVAKTPQEMLAWIRTLTPELHFEPGTRWAYSNSNYVLLGLVAERVSGKPLADLFEERLFRPAKLRATAFDDPRDVVFFRVQGYRKSSSNPSGFGNADWISPTVPGAAGGLRSTGDDLIRWTHALFDGQVLKPDTVKLMTAPGRLNDGRTTRLGMPEAWQKGLNSDYAMGFFVTPTPHGIRISHTGDVDGFSTWLAHFPRTGVTIAAMLNSQSADIDKDGIAAGVFDLREKGCTGQPGLLQ